MVFTMRSFFLSVLALVVICGFAVPAKADYVVWKDHNTGVSLSWPDTWKIVSNADADDVVTIMPPSGRAHAACRVRAREDARYVIYPPRYSWAVQEVAYSYDFFDSYLMEYTNPVIYETHDGAGLGRGFAGYALAGYESAVQGPYMERMAMIFASVYNGTAYILECSSHKDAFWRWQKLFLSIAGSVDFEKAHHELITGHYAHEPIFIKDPPIEFMGDEGPNRILY